MAHTPTRVLVAYATAGGSTREVAERIGARLGAVGEVDVRTARPDLDLARYDAFVVGSAVHDMAWLPPGRELLERLAPEAGARPVWLFSVGGLDPRGRVRAWMGRQELARIGRGLPRHPPARDHRLFAGVVGTRGVPLWGRLFYRAMGERPGDHRDWPAIEAWAADIAATLAPSPAGTRTR